MTPGPRLASVEALLTEVLGQLHGVLFCRELLSALSEAEYALFHVRAEQVENFDRQGERVLLSPEADWLDLVDPLPRLGILVAEGPDQLGLLRIGALREGLLGSALGEVALDYLSGRLDALPDQPRDELADDLLLVGHRCRPVISRFQLLEIVRLPVLPVYLWRV